MVGLDPVKKQSALARNRTPICWSRHWPSYPGSLQSRTETDNIDSIWLGHTFADHNRFTDFLLAKRTFKSDFSDATTTRVLNFSKLFIVNISRWHVLIGHDLQCDHTLQRVYPTSEYGMAENGVSQPLDESRKLRLVLSVGSKWICVDLILERGRWPIQTPKYINSLLHDFIKWNTYYLKCIFMRLHDCIYQKWYLKRLVLQSSRQSAYYMKSDLTNWERSRVD